MTSLQIVLANIDYPLAQAASCLLAGRGIQPQTEPPTPIRLRF